MSGVEMQLQSCFRQLPTAAAAYSIPSYLMVHTVLTDLCFGAPVSQAVQASLFPKASDLLFGST